jgi:hypothetical protein
MSFVIASFLVIGFERVFFTPVPKFLTCLLRQGDANPAFSWNADIEADIATLFCTEPVFSTFCCMYASTVGIAAGSDAHPWLAQNSVNTFQCLLYIFHVDGLLHASIVPFDLDNSESKSETIEDCCLSDTFIS